MSTNTFALPDPIKCLLEKDPETGVWVGRCLDFDLVTSGRDPEAAWTNLKSVVKLHIEHCFTHDRGGLRKHRAPDEFFEMFEKGATKPYRSDKINLNLVAPRKVPDRTSFWIQGVELAFSSKAHQLQAIH